MALYTYACTDKDCSHEFTRFCPMQERDNYAPCPECGMPTRRVYGVPALNTSACGETYEINKNFEGRDEAERTATRKRDDAAYAASYGNRF